VSEWPTGIQTSSPTVCSAPRSGEILFRKECCQTLEILCGIGRNHGISVLAAGGTSNHSHLLIVLPPDMPVAKAVQVLKTNSSRWLREHGLDFAWQEGYGAFSVSSSNKEVVKDYIQHQAQHHQKRSYESEFETMLHKSGIAFDAKDAFG